MERQHLFLGIDGGGTQCRARVTDAAGRLLGQGRAGPSNTRLGIERTFREILKATAGALAEAGLGDSALGRLHAGAGLAGLTMECDRSEAEAHPHPFASLTLSSDAYAACLGAFEGEDGGIMVLGTGSCGCAILSGEVVTVGGWGFELANQGSGAHAGLDAIRSALLAHEGVIPATPLADRILERFGGSSEEASLWAETAEPADYGSFAGLVVDLADQGDPLACDVMRRSGAEASKLIRALRRRGAERIALVGGFSGPLRPWLDEAVQAWLVEPRGDAVDGALILARRALVEERAAR